MKKSTKRFCLKLVTGILSTTIVASVALPMNVLATTVDSLGIISENIVVDSISDNYTENIIREIKEERDEFSKTFLMTDGTYYTCISPVAIHEFIEDEWVDIDDTLSAAPATISEAEEMVKEYVEEAENTFGETSAFSLTQPDTSVTINCIGGATPTSTGYKLTGNSALVIKPNNITQFSAKNQVLLSATINTTIVGNPTNMNKMISIKEVSSATNTNTSFDVINAENDIYYKRYQSTQSEYCFDITDTYSQWERENLDNNGVSLVISNITGMPFNLSTPILSLRYKDASVDDSSFTYHTLDLGRAGILSINDVTNAFKLEQTIAGLDCSLLPVKLTKIIDSANFSLDTLANVSSRWNYEYTLEINGSNATVTLPQGTKIEFQKPDSVLTSSAYQEWTQETGENYVSGVKLYVTQNAATAGGIGNNYEDCYIDIDDIKYGFSSYGKLKFIEKANKRLMVSYGYSNEVDEIVINKLFDANGNQYCITYSTYRINNVDYLYANKIEVKDSTGSTVNFDNAPLIINVTNSVSNNIITSNFSYPSETDTPVSVAYNYDLNGKLISVQGADGTITELHYKSEDNSYLTGYTQKKNNEVINSFTISSENTFERVFDGTLIQKEIQRYDTNFQLVTYYYGNNIIGITYKDGIIDSYAVNNLSYEETQNMVDNGDFSRELSKSNWTNINTNDIDAEFYYNENVLVENTTANATVGITQYIESLPVDTTLVFSAEANILKSIPSSDYKVKIDISLFDANFSLIENFSLPFDLSLINDTQTRLCAFKTDVPCSAIVTISAEGNVGRFLVDNIRLYEATPEDGSVEIPGVSISDPIANTTTENGQVKTELITDGTYYMIQEYEYSSDGAKIVHINDFNDVSTYFDYSGRAGLLSEKGHAIDNNNIIVDPVSYEYNRTGLLKYVTQTINSVTGEEQELSTEYTYDSSGRITSVFNNDYCYNFIYNDIGNITNINKESISSEIIEPNALIEYSYNDNNNIGYIVYSNGYKLGYSYNELGEITNITCYELDENDNYNVVGSYTYTYSNGRISETVINSNDLSHDVKIKTTDTSIDIYYLQNNVELLAYSKEISDLNTVEKFVSSVSGSNDFETLTRSKITETTVGTTRELYSEFYGEKLSMADSDLTVITNGSNNIVTDYFGRVVSKHFTLESNVRDNAPTNNMQQTSENSDMLVLTQNYTYKNLGSTASPYGIRTTNLIESITNEMGIGTRNNGSITTTELDGFAYNYAYDSRGNIRFVYRFSSDGDNYLESYYQYDEANQVTACMSPLGFEFYLYDNNGNIIEKVYCEEITISGVDVTLLEQLEEVTYETWNDFDWTAFNDMHITPFEPYASQCFTYDSLGRMNTYEEKSFSYDSEGNATATVEYSLEIPYDEYGNPLKYVGKNANNDTVIADLSWNGNQLANAIIYSGSTPSQQLIFTYDENGFRINKTIKEYSSNTNSFIEKQQINYVWENGKLLNLQLAIIDENTEGYIYTNILYDNAGSPCGIITPMGVSYYFLKDSSDNVRGLVNASGEIIADFYYDAFGSLYMDVKGDTIIDELINTITVMYNPCTYKGYLYDYELGVYFIQNKCYSPNWGRTLNETDIEKLINPVSEPVEMNLHLICNNNLVNGFDVNAEWDRNRFTFASDQSHGIQVEMSKVFLSRPFCTLYASKILSESGSWDYLNGRNFKNMGVERIAANLFARCVGNYAEKAVNRVNATWGDGWIVSNRNSDIITISEIDPNIDKYFKIWLAAPSIRAFATVNGIYITL